MYLRLVHATSKPSRVSISLPWWFTKVNLCRVIVLQLVGDSPASFFQVTNPAVRRDTWKCLGNFRTGHTLLALHQQLQLFQLRHFFDSEEHFAFLSCRKFGQSLTRKLHYSHLTALGPILFHHQT